MSSEPSGRSRLFGPAFMVVLGLLLAAGALLSMQVGTVRWGWLLIGWYVLVAIGLGLAGLGGVTVLLRLLRRR